MMPGICPVFPASRLYVQGLRGGNADTNQGFMQPGLFLY
jgi:hypothetical protein